MNAQQRDTRADPALTERVQASEGYPPSVTSPTLAGRTPHYREIADLQYLERRGRMLTISEMQARREADRFAHRFWQHLSSVTVIVLLAAGLGFALAPITTALIYLFTATAPDPGMPGHDAGHLLGFGW